MPGEAAPGADDDSDRRGDPLHRSPDAGARTRGAGPDRPWWRTAVVYQVYIRSFADSDGDGVGDLAGIRERLGYLQLLGVDAVWLTPFYPSPMTDHGYDVSDPRDVDPLFGDLAGFDALVTDAHALGLKVVVDLVPNHTSDRHPWFVAALAEPDGPARRRYVFRDGRGQDGAEPPNNWESVFGGPAWTRAPDGQWYLHLFAAEQPDLDWTNPEVPADLELTMRFWLDRGVDGFRIDVAHGMAKPVGLPDVATSADEGDLLEDAGERDPRFDVDEVHDLHRRIRRVLDSYPERMAVGEVWVTDDERLSRYVRPDELHLAFNFRLLQAPWDAAALRAAVEHSLRAMRSVDAPASWALANHDTVRQVTRYGGGEVGLRRARAAALLQLALPGAAFVYYGDELGLPNVELPDEVLQDPVWERSGGTERGRDGERLPMPWGGEKPPYDFGTESRTWLPMPEGWADLTVEAQLEDGGSTLSLYREALELRRSYAGSDADELEWFTGPDGCLAFRRPGGLLVALNAAPASVPMPPGTVLLASGPLPESGRLPADTAAWLLSPPSTPSAAPAARAASAAAALDAPAGPTAPARAATGPPEAPAAPDAPAAPARPGGAAAPAATARPGAPAPLPPTAPAARAAAPAEGDDATAPAATNPDDASDDVTGGGPAG
jgi:alpha-glucosidase